MKLVLTIKDEKNLTIQLKKGDRVIDHEYLTIGQDFDNMLIVAIDKLADRNRIDRLFFKAKEIQGKMRSGAVSEMIFKAFRSGLTI